WAHLTKFVPTNSLPKVHIRTVSLDSFSHHSPLEKKINSPSKLYSPITNVHKSLIYTLTLHHHRPIINKSNQSPPSDGGATGSPNRSYVSFCDGLLQKPVPWKRLHISFSKSSVFFAPSSSAAAPPSRPRSTTSLTSLSNSSLDPPPLLLVVVAGGASSPPCWFCCCFFRRRRFFAFRHSPAGTLYTAITTMFISVHGQQQQTAAHSAAAPPATSPALFVWIAFFLSSLLPLTPPPPPPPPFFSAAAPSVGFGCGLSASNGCLFRLPSDGGKRSFRPIRWKKEKGGENRKESESN
ncbi:unnamed protein product, partial [Linum tenue]